MKRYEIGLFIGSLRRDSINRRLATALKRLAPPELGFTEIAIGDLPLYNQDHEIVGGLPAGVQRMKEALEPVQGVLFVTPEYNRSVPGVLKNALDWASRPKGANSVAGKAGAVCGAAPGAIGTAAGQQHLRTVLAALDVHTMGQPEFYLQFTPDLISMDGQVHNEGTQAFLRQFMQAYAGWVRRLCG
ncbi:2-hydroxy-1,4-benzoquinone reductase [Cupriavidus laharis]|uniref:2-hydroxy-1,4-benzoquinone reductase n=1 Tax=Cupriavidus laharis TaxID=151654 RepID=A0ABN7Y4A0_9BURK|nr:NADPH-dependent FMN reductase [Cupriavidus laharis]CAG9167556.1 2-hydroxy-1,4-benzoquinone reductase [Cupriavidus laharis]